MGAVGHGPGLICLLVLPANARAGLGWDRSASSAPGCQQAGLPSAGASPPAGAPAKMSQGPGASRGGRPHPDGDGCGAHAPSGGAHARLELALGRGVQHGKQGHLLPA